MRRAKGWYGQEDEQIATKGEAAGRDAEMRAYDSVRRKISIQRGMRVGVRVMRRGGDAEQREEEP